MYMYYYVEALTLHVIFMLALQEHYMLQGLDQRVWHLCAQHGEYCECECECDECECESVSMSVMMQ